MAQIQMVGCDVAFVEGIFLEFSDATGRFLWHFPVAWFVLRMPVSLLWDVGLVVSE